MSRETSSALVLAGLVATVAMALGASAPAPNTVAVPGMVAFAGGHTRIGSEGGPPSESPPFMAEVKPFLLDIHPVTVGEFREFVEATRFVTQSERAGSSGVFDAAAGSWGLVDGASWHHPLGPSSPAAAADHPVTQVSWNDAVAYCTWRGKRLPTEIEWEHAARNGRNGGPQYAWGDQLVVDGHYKANTWQGTFPTRNTVEDGYRYTSPVGAFGVMPSGLTDMGGNVWQWCQDWYRPYPERDRPFTPATDSEKVTRGGSFMCDPKFCHGFRVSARGHTAPDTGLMHIGFRCAKDPGGAPARGAGAPAATPGAAPAR
jgi:formylglycine-generating enzyme